MLYMIISRKAILQHAREGRIVYHSDKYTLAEFANNQSVDIHLGQWIYVKNKKQWFDISKEGYKVEKGDFILCHSEEFIGTAPFSNIHPRFMQRSTTARDGWLHPIAGWGDVGYHNRWTMEFYMVGDTTVDRETKKEIPLVLKEGIKVGQICFEYTTHSDDYSELGSYQSSNNLKDIIRDWKKEDILSSGKY